MDKLPEFITLQITTSTWRFVEEICPFAKENPTAALSFLLGIASGVLLNEKIHHEQKQ